jgi:Flp pilus assembly pilin Flp
MRTRVNKTFVKYHDWQTRRQFEQDEDGLSLVAYALGAAFIVVPMAIALFLFGQQATTRADADLAKLLATSTPAVS